MSRKTKVKNRNIFSKISGMKHEMESLFLTNYHGDNGVAAWVIADPLFKLSSKIPSYFATFQAKKVRLLFVLFWNSVPGVTLEIPPRVSLFLAMPQHDDTAFIVEPYDELVTEKNVLSVNFWHFFDCMIASGHCKRDKHTQMQLEPEIRI